MVGKKLSHCSQQGDIDMEGAAPANSCSKSQRDRPGVKVGTPKEGQRASQDMGTKRRVRRRQQSGFLRDPQATSISCPDQTSVCSYAGTWAIGFNVYANSHQLVVNYGSSKSREIV